MSEYAEIRVKRLSLYNFRNYLSKDVVELLFTRGDLSITPNYIVDSQDEDSVPYTRYVYKTTVGKARERLDVMGYGIDAFEAWFDNYANEIIYYYPFLTHLHIEYDDQEEKARARIEKYVTFKKWTNSMHKIVKHELEYGNITHFNTDCSFKISTECDKVIYYSLIENESNSYYAINTEVVKIAYIIRLILEYCDVDDDVILDFSNLGLWADDCIPKAIETTGNTEKAIILVEGTSDKEILEFALSYIYPNLVDLFYFMEFEDEQGKKRGAGAAEIRKHMETFYYSKLRVRFIAVFDNDAVGYHNSCLLRDQIRTTPDNIRILCYPEIIEFKKYPTLASNGSIIYDDINKKACSIELYLPDNLINDGEGYYPIEWENRERIKRINGDIEYLYQGVILNKQQIKERFVNLKNKINRGEESFVLEEWDRMKKVLDRIVFAFTKKF